MAKNKNFEETLHDLEKVVKELESGELSLELSLEKFENGVKLYKSCKDLLSTAEKKISKLTDNLKEEELEFDDNRQE